MSNAPEVLDYDDFRKYLKDWYLWRKQQFGSYTYKRFSQDCGYQSSNFLHLVIQGKRDLSEQGIERVRGALSLKGIKRTFFITLVQFNQEDDPEFKAVHHHKLYLLRKKRGHKLKSKQYNYLSNWYYAAICELLNLKKFRNDPKWIAKKLGGTITEAQARKAIEDLLTLGMIATNEQGALKTTNEYFTTGAQTQAMAAYYYHEQMTERSLKALRQDDPERRNMTALTFSIREKDYHEIVEAISRFRSQIIQFLNGRLQQGEDDDLYQFNLHLFPLSSEVKS